MKFLWSRSLRLSLCAAAVCALGAVHAQTAAPANPEASAPASAQAPTPPAPSQAQPHEGKKPQHMQRHHKPRKEGQRAHHGQRGKYATPQEHEAAAARAEERAGRLRSGNGDDQYQRNALARCDVFRDTEDRHSCVERMRAGEVIGSVKEGGVLREFSEQVPVQP